jgi:DNA-binding XRE family transcriptional regulator
VSRRDIFTNYLWTYRKKKGYSQVYLAEIVGKDKSQICKWERGIKIPSLISAIELAIVLEAPIECLYHDYFITTLEKLRSKEEKLQETTNCYEQQLHQSEIMGQGSRFKSNIWMFRKKRGYKQGFLAHLLELKDQTPIFCWEKDIKIPNLKNAIKLAISLHTSVECLFYEYYKTIRQELKNKGTIANNKNYEQKPTQKK